MPPFEPPEPTRRGDVTWLQPYPDTLLEQVAERAPGPEARYQQREAIELAFVTALQHLPPRQTATLLLCDVLGYSRAEVAAMLDTSQTAIKGATTVDIVTSSAARTPGVGQRADGSSNRGLCFAPTGLRRSLAQVDENTRDDK